MPELGLILTLATSLGAALIGGYITHRLGLSPIAGYLLAGVALGPNTPGFIADPELAEQLAATPEPQRVAVSGFLQFTDVCHAIAGEGDAVAVPVVQKASRIHAQVPGRARR